MAKTSIGIKIADGSFYPVLEEENPGRKRVILTTVKDNQTGAQIDLYRGNGTGVSGATYIGTLVVDEIEPAPKGNPEIELIVKLDGAGNLDAEASDHITGEHQTLSVALDSLIDDENSKIPDFDLDERYQPELGVSPAEESRLTSEPVSTDFSVIEEDVQRRRRRRTLQYVGIAVLVVAIVALVFILIFWFTRRTAPSAASRAVSKSTVATVTTAEPGGTPAPSPNSAQAASSAPPRSSKAQYRVGGVVYQVRWGDTLWDLSLSFYRTPWLYGKIAKANRIKNPNLIFAHSQIYIPER